MIIDSHAHYTHFKFENSFRYLAREGGEFVVREGSLKTVLNDLAEAGFTAFIEPAIELSSNEKLLCFCREHPGFHPAVGVHPTRTAALKRKDRAALAGYAEDENVVAIGETGLDLHLPRAEQHRLRQIIWFRFQIELAHRKKLPLVLHIRRAHRAAVTVLRLHRKKLHGGVAHCFNGTARQAAELVGLGLHIAVGGALLRGNAALEEAVRTIPLERLLVETDAPYEPPAFPAGELSKRSARNVRNTSLILPTVIERIAELKGMDAGAVEEAIFLNTRRLFGLE